MSESDKKHRVNGSKNGGKQETTHGDLKIEILGLIFLGGKKIVSSNASPPLLNLGQTFIRQQEVRLDRWKEEKICL